MKIVDGKPSPLGFSLEGTKGNFAVFSSSAKQLYLALFSVGSQYREMEMKKTGDIWHLGVQDLPDGFSYAFRRDMDKTFFVDPYAKRIENGKALASLPSPFDWQDTQSPSIPFADLILYEIHVRGLTRSPSAHVKHPGTYLGVIEKIPFFKELGINAVELMPIFDSDPMQSKNISPTTGQHLPNYWGYNVSHFFHPRAWYAVHDGVTEFKMMVRELHRAGIEVILDVVYNHTGEGKDKSHSLNFRGLDNNAYYIMLPNGEYANYSGCDNTFNCNHPAAKSLILDSLRYWAEEMQVDGFRFDLASIMTRGADGKPMDPAPLLVEIKNDPVLKNKKLIAESWDAAGLYQVGSFPKWGPWSEWNDKYRDTVRDFIKGTAQAGTFANVLTGSEMVYKGFSPLASVNFITAHDGFTLRDLVTYQQKHNLENGEHNQDGNSSNHSWNCGHEGPTENAQIAHLREKQMRNFFLALLLSQGIPMLVMNDIYGHSAKGNNNPFVQDNELSWFCWDELKKNEKIFRFVAKLIAFRKNHSGLRSDCFWKEGELDWHKTDWHSHFISCTFKEERIYLAFNASNQAKHIALPSGNWKQVVNTEEDWHVHEQGMMMSSSMEMSAHSALLAIEV